MGSICCCEQTGKELIQRQNRNTKRVPVLRFEISDTNL